VSDPRTPGWDALIVGSGATGGAAARVLARSGMRVLLLEAGNAVTRRQTHSRAFENVSRAIWRKARGAQSIQSLHPTYWTTNPDFFVRDTLQPYDAPREAPFHWIRGRQLGGRTLTWDAVTPRFSDWELAGHWPIRHADLDAQYAELEQALGVHGTKEGLPQLPDGDFVDRVALTPAEELLKGRVERTFPERKVISSRGLRWGRRPEKGESCSKISSTGTTLREARASGRLAVRTGVMVARVLTTRGGTRATGVEVIDAETGDRSFIAARSVILCASTLESVRILMNSHTPAHPHGIGGTSGTLGRFIMDHCASNIYFTLPGVRDATRSHPLTGAHSFMVPRFSTSNGSTQRGGFGFWGGVQRIGVPRLFHRDPHAAFGFLCARSEVEPRAENRAEIASDLTDAWGVPALRIECRWSERDRELASWARAEARRLIEAAGGQTGAITDHFRLGLARGLLDGMQDEWNRSTPGIFAHEVGGARMSASPEDGVVDPFCRVWDVPNVLVTDGACWPSCGWQNPTLHMMALTTRACEELVRTSA
jgi:choline dehydrogenase-like flavoprotein